MIAKMHFGSGRKILAICDENLLGNIIEEENRQLDLNSNFFSGNKVDMNELAEMISETHILNAVGKKTIEHLIKLKLLSEKEVKIIANIPYSIVVLIRED